MMRNKAILTLFGGSVLLLLVAALVGFVGLPQEPGGLLVFRFDAASDRVALLGGIGNFFGLLGVAAVIVALNFFLALEVYGRERFLSYVFAAGTLAISILFLVVAVTITAAN